MMDISLLTVVERREYISKNVAIEFHFHARFRYGKYMPFKTGALKFPNQFLYTCKSKLRKVQLSA